MQRTWPRHRKLCQRSPQSNSNASQTTDRLSHSLGWRFRKSAVGEYPPLDHHADQRFAALHTLGDQVLPDLLLPRVLLVGIRMAAVHHQHRGQIRLAQLGAGIGDARRIIVGPGAPPAQHDMAVQVALGRNNRGDAILVDAQEMMGMPRRQHGIERYLK